MPAYVYLVEELPHPGELTVAWTMIGVSEDPPEWRVAASLQRGNPRKVRVTITFEYATIVEARETRCAANDQFSSCKHGKGWFQVPWEDVARWMDGVGAVRRAMESVGGA